MRLYTLSKRHFVLMFVVFFICFGLTVFVGIEGKSVFQSFFHLQRLGLVQPAQLCPLAPSQAAEGREVCLLSEPTGRKVVVPSTCLLGRHGR